MKIETKTTLTFKDGTTVNVDETELRELLAALKARFDCAPAVVPMVPWTPWIKPVWVDFHHTRPLMPPYEVTCLSAPQ